MSDVFEKTQKALTGSNSQEAITEPWDFDDKLTASEIAFGQNQEASLVYNPTTDTIDFVFNI